MRKFVFAAAALSLAAITSLPAYAAEGNGDPFPPATDGTQIFSGGMLPTTGHAGVLQSANSLPPGWANGTAPVQYAQSVNRYFAQQGNGVSSTQTAEVTAGGVLPSNGQGGVVQSANSLPPGWADGTAPVQYAQSVNRYFAQQANRAATQTAQAPLAWPHS
ncbi:MAG TPA: hypothetical protein VE650_13075 [Acetobacteraceae bacterium]|nr:hypothetical protein [Acetobacteraceae bacterium]